MFSFVFSRVIYLAAAAADIQIPVASFDRDLDKFKDISRFEPKSR